MTDRKRKPLTNRFWQNVKKTDGCWIWTGPRQSNGYGRLSDGGNGGFILAHRLSWQLHYGPIPQGESVCHSCNKLLCVRPTHLFTGTSRNSHGRKMDRVRRLAYDSVRRLSSNEAVWLACAIDGEGTIGFHDYGNKQGRYIQLQVFNTFRKFTFRARKLVGNLGTVIIRRRPGPRKPLYAWYLKGSARCIAVLEQILPWLIIKRAKAKNIIREFYESPFGRWSDPQKSKKRKEELSEWARNTWRDPVMREARLNGMRASFTIKRRGRLSKIFRAAWRDPTKRVRLLAGRGKPRNVRCRGVAE